MDLLGVPGANLRFLDLPESGLAACAPSVQRLLVESWRKFVPITYAHRSATTGIPITLRSTEPRHRRTSTARSHGSLSEYFVYHRWRLLPRRQHPSLRSSRSLISVDIGPVAKRKRAALACFASQTTRYYRRGRRPHPAAGAAWMTSAAGRNCSCATTRHGQEPRYSPGRCRGSGSLIDSSRGCRSGRIS